MVLKQSFRRRCSFAWTGDATGPVPVVCLSAVHLPRQTLIRFLTGIRLVGCLLACLTECDDRAQCLPFVRSFVARRGASCGFLLSFFLGSFVFCFFLRSTSFHRSVVCVPDATHTQTHAHSRAHARTHPYASRNVEFI